MKFNLNGFDNGYKSGQENAYEIRELIYSKCGKFMGSIIISAIATVGVVIMACIGICKLLITFLKNNK